MHERSPYIPLPEVNPMVLQVYSVLPPYVDPQTILVHEGRMELLGRIAGIRRIRVVGERGEQTNFTPLIVGHQNGEAIAGRIDVATTDTSTSEAEPLYNPDTSGRFHQLRRVDMGIKMDMAQVVAEINHNDKWPEGTRSSRAWATHLNRAIKTGVLTQGADNLTNISQYEIIDAAVIYLTTTFGNLLLLPPELLPDNLVLIGVIQNLRKFYESGCNPDFRRSFIYGPQLDRALALWLATQFSTLVKAEK